MSSPRIYGIEEAARYLEMSTDGLKYWVYRVEEDRRLEPCGHLGRVPYWTREALDAFRARRAGEEVSTTAAARPRVTAYGDPISFDPGTGQQVKGTVVGLMANAYMALYDGEIHLVPREKDDGSNRRN